MDDVCCGGRFHIRQENFQCCNGQYVLVLQGSICCSNDNGDLSIGTGNSCCGGTPYTDNGDLVCCGETLQYNHISRLCCGDVMISSLTTECCSGIAFFRESGKTCCGSQYVETDTTLCCTVPNDISQVHMINVNSLQMLTVHACFYVYVCVRGCMYVHDIIH